MCKNRCALVISDLRVKLLFPVKINWSVVLVSGLFCHIGKFRCGNVLLIMSWSLVTCCMLEKLCCAVHVVGLFACFLHVWLCLVFVLSLHLYFIYSLWSLSPIQSHLFSPTIYSLLWQDITWNLFSLMVCIRGQTAFSDDCDTCRHKAKNLVVVEFGLSHIAQHSL